jgi:hypothetical protein
MALEKMDQYFSSLQVLQIPANGDEKKPERTDMGTKAIAMNGKGYKTIKKGEDKEGHKCRNKK